MTYPFIKNPLTTFDYVFDFSSQMETGETISTATLTVPAGLTEVNSITGQQVVAVWLSGGTEGERYDVICTATSDQARVYSETIEIIMQNELYDLLIPLRVRLGDTTPASYRYADVWLLTALTLSVQALMRWWNYKYLLDAYENIYRNPNITFLFPEPPVIEHGDQDIIVLMAAIIILEGSLENNSWNAVSWRDNEISFSNLEQFRQKDNTLARLWNELTQLITPPNKKLAFAKKSSLPGYRENKYEYNKGY